MIHFNCPKGNRAHRQDVAQHPFPDFLKEQITSLLTTSAKQHRRRYDASLVSVSKKD